MKPKNANSSQCEHDLRSREPLSRPANWWWNLRYRTTGGVTGHRHHRDHAHPQRQPGLRPAELSPVRVLILVAAVHRLGACWPHRSGTAGLSLYVRPDRLVGLRIPQRADGSRRYLQSEGDAAERSAGWRIAKSATDKGNGSHTVRLHKSRISATNLAYFEVGN